MRNLLLLLLSFLMVNGVFAINPPAYPSNVKASQVKIDNKIEVTWSEPSIAKGYTYGYYIYYQEEKASSTIDSVEIKGKTTSYTITNLNPEGTYHIWMKTFLIDKQEVKFSPATSKIKVTLAGLEAPTFTVDTSLTTRSSLTVEIQDSNIHETGFEISLKGGGKDFLIEVNKSGTKITQKVTGLDPNTWYIIKVRAIYGNEKGPWSEEEQYKTIIDLPATATLAIEENCPNNVVISWNIEKEFDNVQSMKISQSTDNKNWTDTDLKRAASGIFKDSLTTAGKTYYYRLITSNASGNSLSNTLTVKVPSYQAPNPPSNIRLTDEVYGKTPNSLNITWDLDTTTNASACNINILSHVEVAYKINDGKMTSPKKLSLNETNFLVEGLDLKDKVEFFVRTVSDHDIESNWVTFIEYTFGVPEQPTNFKATPTTNALGEQVIVITWKDNSDDEDFFEILKSKDGVNFYQHAVLKFNLTRLVDVNIKEGESYYYKIGANNWVGMRENIWTYSQAIGPITPNFTTVPEAPYGLRARLNDGGIDLKWIDDTIKESNYVVEKSSNGSNFVTTAQLGRDETTYRDEDITQDKTYYYRVKAINPLGSSGYSNTESVTVYDATGSSDFDVDIYPNPVENILTIRGEGVNKTIEYTVSIYDSNNQLVFQRNISFESQDTVEIDVSALNSGVYIFTISDQKNVVSKKLVKL